MNPGTATGEIKILIVEDDPSLRTEICDAITRAGWNALPAESGETALHFLATASIRLVILDWILPLLSGAEILRQLRGGPQIPVPVLVLTVRQSSESQIYALELGADDYLVKPVRQEILVARVQALLRRAGVESQPKLPRAETIQREDLVLNLTSHEVTCAGSGVSLTLSEYEVLKLLMERPGRAFSRKELLERLRGNDPGLTLRAIDTHIFGLRRKLGKCGEMIQAVRAVGYRMR